MCVFPLSVTVVPCFLVQESSKLWIPRPLITRLPFTENHILWSIFINIKSCFVVRKSREQVFGSPEGEGEKCLVLRSVSKAQAFEIGPALLLAYLSMAIVYTTSLLSNSLAPPTTCQSYKNNPIKVLLYSYYFNLDLTTALLWYKMK